MLDLAIACQERHHRFVRRVVASGQVWGLKNADGWCYAPSNGGDDEERDEAEERDVLPFWSDRAYAKQCAKDEWSDYEPTSIPLEQFLKAWLPGMAGDGVLVGTNWSAHLIGLEVDPLELKQEIESHIARQETERS
jgi:hypothetical protein